MSDSSKAVFLSYASQDAEAATRIAEALRAAGVEVWFDQAELVGGDSWDTKIRKQIKECALFVPVISANTQARSEGYFRLEWRLADQRTHLMAKGRPFLLPVVIDATRDAEAQVPDSFTEVQWTRLRQDYGGQARDDATERFCERVKELLGGEGRDASPRRPSTDLPESSGRLGETSLPAKPSRPWLVPAIIGVVALAALGVWQPWKSSVGPAAGKSAETTKVAGPLTPAQELVAKARVILDEGDEINRENYSLAEELLKKAEVLDPSEATAWALHAQVSVSLHWFGFDISSARREAMRVQASRALTLAPESDDAQLAAVRVQIELDQNQAESLRTLEALVKRSPENWPAWRSLGRCLRKQGDADGASVALRQALKLSANHPAVVNDLFNHLTNVGEFAEAERAIRELPAGRKSARLLAHDLFNELYWRGNPASAAATVAGWPSWFLVEDRGAGHAALAALWNRDPAQAQKILASYPRDYLRDYLFTGPRAVLTAWANEQAGNEEAAQADWKIARQVAERILGEFPDDREALYWKAWALARLGDRPGATAVVRLLEQREARSNGLFIFGGLAGLKTALGDIAGAVDQLAKVRANLQSNIKPITKAFLTLNPVFDPLRGNARFQALVASAPAPAETKESATANVPKDDKSAPADKSVAVLAFANLSDDKGNEYFSDGISEELLNVLAKVPGLKVSARTSAFYFKGKEVPIPEIARQLGVAYVVEGSVRKQGERVRITAQLIKAADGFHVWSDTFTRDLKDIFAVQDEIAGLVAQNLQLKMGVSIPARTVNPEAYRLVLEGRHFVARRSEADFISAEKSFRQALAFDPEFAPAYAGIADAAVLLGSYRLMEGSSVQPADFVRAKDAAARALALDPTMAEPHHMLGLLHVSERKFAEAEGEFAEGFRLNPNYAIAFHWHSLLLAAMGRFDEAIVALERSINLDPLASTALFNYGRFLLAAGRTTEALAPLDRAIALRPTFFAPGRSTRALILLGLGRTEEALAEARLVRKNLDAPTRWFGDGDALYVIKQAGRPGEAEDYLRELRTKFPADSHVLGNALLAAGQTDEGLRLMAGSNPLSWTQLYWTPMMEPLHATPRVRAFFAGLGAAGEYDLARRTLARLRAENAAKK